MNGRLQGNILTERTSLGRSGGKLRGRSSGEVRGRASGRGTLLWVRLLVYLFFFSGILSIVLYTVFGPLSYRRGVLACIAWLMLFILAEVNSRSSENRKLLALDEKRRLESVGRIQLLVSKLKEKSLALNNSYESERQLLSDLNDVASDLKPSADLEASKMEYEILTGLTRLDFLCDKAIAGTDRNGDFKKELDSLSSKLRARERL